MERTKISDLMGTFKRSGMRSAYDDVLVAGIKCKDEPPRLDGGLQPPQIAESIR